MFEKLKQKLRAVKDKLAGRIQRKKEEPESKPEEPKPEQPEPKPEVKPLAPPEHPGVTRVRRAIKKMVHRRLSEEDLQDILWDLHVALLESDTALPVAEQIIQAVKSELVNREIGLRDDARELAEQALRAAVRRVLTPSVRVNILETIERRRAEGQPAVIVFFGVNGVGKTTAIAKLAKYLSDRGYKVLLAASDTFRAAGIEQLEMHAARIGVPVIKQRRGADAAAVAYDAIAHARARGFDVVLVDTAGRMQTDVDLMEEMKKIVRVTKPDLKIFVGDALAGNDAVEQALAFERAVGIDGAILCKMDADARGGAALSISQVTGKPILMLGTGQRYEDLVEFKPELILSALFAN
ncbi:MAG: signal recognition particle-docking protein FtsY [Candidatus Hadarchaeales archaeon]